MQYPSPLKILYINHYAGSPQRGMEHRPYFLAKQWTQEGHAVLIVAASLSHLRKDNPRFSGLWSSRLEGGLNYLWLKTSSYKKNGLARLVNIFCFLLQLVLQFPRFISFRPNMIVASSTYPLDTIPAFWLGKITGARVVHEIHDLWPLTLIELFGMSASHPFIRLLSWAEKFSYRHSDFIASMLPGADTYLSSKGMSSEKYFLVPNGYDSDVEEEAIPEDFLPQMARFAGFFKVGYAGYFGVANAMDDLLLAAEQVKESNIVFFLVGEGPELEKYKKISHEKNLRIVFFPKIKKTQVKDFLKQADACYLGWKDRNIYRYGISPNKLIDYMAAEKPIIHASSASKDLVQMANCGISVPAEDIDAIARALIDMSHLSDLQREQLGKNGSVFLIQHLTYKQLAQRFLSVLSL